MPPFQKPGFEFGYGVHEEIAALRRYRDTEPGRAIPAKRVDRLLLASWNVANLGLQERRVPDYQLIAEVVSWFDLVALQEVNDDLVGLNAILGQLPGHYRYLHSDVAGNDERLAFVYDSLKVNVLELVGEVAVPPKDQRYIRLPVTEQKFTGFDRNPYLAAFRAGTFTLVLVNVHLYFGSDSTRSENRRSLETYAVARWADLRRKSKTAFTHNIISLGDFNLPKTEPGDPVYDALTRRGLEVPRHATQIAATISSHNQYDQMAFFPGPVKEAYTGTSGVFDFDGAIFSELWDSRGRDDFLAYTKYFVSDHRPLWAEFEI